MRLRRTIPPTAAPLQTSDLWYGILGMALPRKAIERFEREIQREFSATHVFAVSSGKAALVLILQALASMSSRREVIIPAYTCFSVPSAIAKAGLKVTLCDVNPETFDFDAVQLARLVSDNTLCVIPSHLFGIPSAMDVTMELAHRNGAFVVEDAAQAMGGCIGGGKIGMLGDVALFSFGRGKSVTSGSGGLILTNSQSIGDAIRRLTEKLEKPSFVESVKELAETALMTLFIHPLLYWIPARLPFLKLGQTFYYDNFPVKAMSGMKAGLLRRWRIRLQESNHARATAGRHFSGSLGAPSIADLPYLRFPLLMGTRAMRDGVLRQSSAEGLGMSPMYPTAIHEIPRLSDQFKGVSYPGASRIAECLVALPTHPLVRPKDRDRIIELLRARYIPMQKACVAEQKREDSACHVESRA